MPDNKRRKVRVGSKLSASSVKQSEHETRAARDQAHEKELENLKINTNTKARLLH